MGSKVLIEGADHNIVKGKTLVDATERTILKGKTLIQGTEKTIFLTKVSEERWTSPGSYTWTCPVTGRYTIELHGGGGGGGASSSYSDVMSGGGSNGSGGGGSGELYENVTLTEGEYFIMVGAGGKAVLGEESESGGASYVINKSNSQSYSVNGGGGGRGILVTSLTTSGPVGGKASGSLGTDGDTGTGGRGGSNSATWTGSSAGGEGNKNNTAQSYGDGGKGCTEYNGQGGTTAFQKVGENGKDGAVIITYVGP